MLFSYMPVHGAVHVGDLTHENRLFWHNLRTILWLIQVA